MPDKTTGKPATLRGLALVAGRTFGGLFLHLCPSVVAIPVTAGAQYMRGQVPHGFRPGLIVTNSVGIAIALAAGWVSQRFAPVPTLSQIAAAYLGTCGAVALAGTAGYMALLGWRD